MEPNREEQKQAMAPGAEQKPKRFRIVKLEERIAPSQGKGNTGNCYHSRRTDCCWFYTINCPY
jgi:hypothetical protein